MTTKEHEQKQQVRNVIDISQIPCPACGRSDRWDAMVTREPAANNPELIVCCDCGIGELVIVVE